LKFTIEEIEAEILPPSWPVTESFNGHVHLNVRCRAKTVAGNILSICRGSWLDIDEATTRAAKTPRIEADVVRKDEVVHIDEFLSVGLKG
jgi:hypothetical protein